jgi:sporulation protein YlmC with PRC-barrel domain
MSSREVLLSNLIGRTVRDADGRSIGRIEELRAEIELRDDGVDYVVVEYHVGAYGMLEALAGSHFARHFARLLGRALGYERYCIPWQQMDLGDHTRPRINRRVTELNSLPLDRRPGLTALK